MEVKKFPQQRMKHESTSRDEDDPNEKHEIKSSTEKQWRSQVSIQAKYGSINGCFAI